MGNTNLYESETKAVTTTTTTTLTETEELKKKWGIFLTSLE